MPTMEQWALYQAIDAAYKALKDCSADCSYDYFEPSKHLRLQLARAQRLLLQMWNESELVIRFVMDVEMEQIRGRREKEPKGSAG